MTPAPLLASGLGATDAGAFAAVVLLLVVSAVLALAETGLVRMSKARARALAEGGARGAKSLVKLVEDPESFLAPVLLLVLVCQLVAATLVGVEASRLFGALGVAVATVFEIVVIFVAAEAVPKHWAVRHADRAALLSAPIVTSLVAFPPIRAVSSLLIGLSHLVTPGGDEQLDAAEVTESELLALADVAVDELVLEREERALISSIIDFGDTIVREVMAPRPDIVAVESRTPTSAVLESAMASGLSRIPVYDTTLDDIVGIAFTKDLMRALRSGGDDRPVVSSCRPAHYVPETKRVAPLLREMQADQYHLAVVVDEYGGTAGIVTLEDLIEELVGEIFDEFDVDEPLVEPLSETEYRVSGKMAVDEVNDLLGTDLPVGDWDTVGGLLLHLRGQLPLEGERISAGSEELVAEKVQGRRIGSVRVVRAAPPPPGDDELDEGDPA
ncbi:MAG: hemolysin family protein [Actinomycetota bacterium]|nr:hemolysin family protein [Actinomycetota bacterium]